MNNGRKTHSNAVEDAFEEKIIFGQGFQDLGIGGDINQDCKSRMCDWLLQCVSDEQRWLNR